MGQVGGEFAGEAVSESYFGEREENIAGFRQKKIASSWGSLPCQQPQLRSVVQDLLTCPSGRLVRLDSDSISLS